MQVTFGGISGARGTTPRDCAAVVLDTSLLVIRTLRREVRSRIPAGLSITQMRGLGFVNLTPGASVSDLANHIGLTMAATSRLVGSLAGRGLLKTNSDPADRRRLRLSLTPRGRAHLRVTFEHARNHFAGLLAGLPRGDRSALIHALRRLQPLVAPPARERRSNHAR